MRAQLVPDKTVERLIPISGFVQHYAWGRTFDHALVAKLAGVPREERPYAELWFGAHPNGPSSMVGQSGTLAEALSAAPDQLLGSQISARFGALPFLLKVLSIAKPLSIQAHPDRQLARALHARSPEQYPDDQHKPEMALALTETALLYGFRERSEIEQWMARLPDLQQIVRSDPLSACNDREWIAKHYRALYQASPDAVGKACRALAKSEFTNQDPCLTEFLKLVSVDYPRGDVGILNFIFLNCELLAPGEAVFIGPNVPHAYLWGELLECMANSDNVVRAGLTKKPKDVETLLRMLRYEPDRMQRLSPRHGEYGKEYRPPVDEFMLDILDQTKDYSISPSGSEILLMLEGEATIGSGAQSIVLTPGAAVFVPAVIAGYNVALTSGRLVRASVPVAV